MSRPQKTNVATSVAARLLKIAQSNREDYQYLLMRYALERLLYRLSQSPYSSQFIVKGAFLFLIWTKERHRPTKDLDLMSARQLSEEELKRIFGSVCHIGGEDGLSFLPESISTEEIREGDSYGGVRIKVRTLLGNKKIPIQMDVGFGDAVNPSPISSVFPTLLEFPAPELLTYPKETVVAEKYEIMVSLGITNSRMKDYFDLWSLSQHFQFEGKSLTKAVKATFHRRKTLIPESIPTGLSDEFVMHKSSQWKAFLNRIGLSNDSLPLESVVRILQVFLLPVSQTLHQEKSFSKKWTTKEWKE